MKREGLTFTVIFLAESANYGEGIGNISSLKKMTRGDYEEYSYISRQALRYNMVQLLQEVQLPDLAMRSHWSHFREILNF